MKLLKLTTLAATAIASVGALVVPAAQAGKPVRQVLPTWEPFVEASCPEAVAPEGIRWSDGGGNFAALYFDNGRELKTGRHPDLLTNVATGESVLLDLQGSIRGRPDGDEFRATMHGTNGFIFYPGDVGPGDIDDPRVFVFTGTVRLTFGADGFVTEFASTGRQRDICAEL